MANHRSAVRSNSRLADRPHREQVPPLRVVEDNPWLDLIRAAARIAADKKIAGTR